MHQFSPKTNRTHIRKAKERLSEYIDEYSKRTDEFFEGPEDKHTREFRELGLIVVSVFVSLFLVVGSAAIFLWGPPKHFPVGSVVHVEEGQTLREVAHELARQNVVRFPELFIAGVRYFEGGDESVVAGDYFFKKRHSLFSVTEKVTSGDYGLEPLAVTVPEGVSVKEMAIILDQQLDSFNTKRFVRYALPLEGYLFPDTYEFLPNVDEERVVEKMNENFRNKIADIAEDIEASEHSLEEIVIMASIIEKESEDDQRARRTISGVLWKRIDVGMPLQVDAVFPYIIGRNTFELSLEDLKIDSPYNTYRYKGLPPGPISNPGLSSLKAALDPLETNYLYYLADLNGRTHFAEDFEEHKWNKRQYLD